MYVYIYEIIGIRMLKTQWLSINFIGNLSIFSFKQKKKKTIIFGENKYKYI